MEQRRSSIIRRVLAIILVLPVGYTFFKFNLPNPTFTKFDEILRYLFPVILAVAFIIDTWDRTQNSTRKIMKISIILVAALIFGVFSGLGKELNENPLLGAILFQTLLCSISGISFYFATFQNRTLFKDDSVLRKAYRFAVGCFAFSFIQLPVCWPLFLGYFTTKGFRGIGVLFVTIGVVLSIFGPATPWLIGFVRELNVANNRIRESKK